MIGIKRYIVIFLLPVIYGDDESKWVWGDSGRGRQSERLYTGVVDVKVTQGDSKSESKSPSQRLSLRSDVVPAKSLFNLAAKYDEPFSQGQKFRYEVNEPLYPDQNNNRPIIVENNYRPQRPNGGYRPNPSFRPPYDNMRPTGGYRPVDRPRDRPILTGPVPSWEQTHHGLYQDYDRCKCAHSFNCNSPGIQFGVCDVDKKYCCYKERFEGNVRPSGVREPFDYSDNFPVLAGPGKPAGTTHHGLYHNQYPDRYSSGYQDREDEFNEAYRRGLETAIIETTSRPIRKYQVPYQDHHGDSFNRPHRYGQKYGLYVANDNYDFYSGRSVNKTIV